MRKKFLPRVLWSVAFSLSSTGQYLVFDSSDLSTVLLLWGIYIKKCISPVRICLQTRTHRPYIRLRRKFPRPTPCKRACRSPDGEPEPTPLRGASRLWRKWEPSQPAEKARHLACLFCWLGWPDSNRRVRESKSRALPLGDIPIFEYSHIIP